MSTTLNKNQLNTEFAKLTSSQQFDFNSTSGTNLVFLQTQGSGSEYDVSELVNSVNALSDSDYFWLELRSQKSLILTSPIKG